MEPIHVSFASRRGGSLGPLARLRDQRPVARPPLLLGLVGWVMSRAMPEESPGLIMELPRYRAPRLKALGHKTWFRLKEFVVPLFV